MILIERHTIQSMI